MVNVIGELTEKSSLARTERNCVNIEGEGGSGLNLEEGAGAGNSVNDSTTLRLPFSSHYLPYGYLLFLLTIDLSL